MSVYSGKQLCKSSEDDESFFEPSVPKKASFLKSLLQTVPEADADAEALNFRHNFQKLKYKLSSTLYDLFNDKIFNNQLPELELRWSSWLTKTAGYLKYIKDKKDCYIALSDKLLTSPERLCDILAHEMCHAAVILIHKDYKEKHGGLWLRYAVRCHQACPELPQPRRRHHY